MTRKSLGFLADPLEEGDIEDLQNINKKDNLKPVPVHLGVIRLHPLISIFFFSNPKISRPVRFSLFYLRITLMLSVTGLFSEDTSIY